MKRAIARILGFVSLLLGLFLAVGIYLPGTWSTERSTVIPATPEQVFPWINRVEGWESWTPWPEAGRYLEGPAEGPGAVRGWDDPDFGSGRFTILTAQAPRSISYRVEVEDGSIVVLGWITLEPRGDSVAMTWREEGDFGRNPLLGYAARGMEQNQGAQLELGFARLAELLTTEQSPQ